MSEPAGEFDRLRPHLVNLSNGRLGPGGLASTTPADVDAIFATHLPRFMHGRPGPVQVLFWAHGGLVDERTGLAAAARQVPWWLANGVYPVYFVWETGLLQVLAERIRRGAQRFGLFPALSLMRARSVTAVPARPTLLPRMLPWAQPELEETVDRFVEWLARRAGGPAVWADIKANAARAVDEADGAGDEGGAHYVARRLARFSHTHAGSVQLHAVGHSAGAVFQTGFLKAAFEEGVAAFESLALLDPSVTVDGFKRGVLPLLGNRIRTLSQFGLGRQRALDDVCEAFGVTFYNKSLLYLIHHVLEEEPDTPLVGLQENVAADPELAALFAAGQVAEAVWSPQLGGPADSRSDAREHAGIDSDRLTMESLARRITGREDIVGFP
ncbi:hypothetical protein D477_015848 [Arthrobacter crystallopoietes BAB-32]|uniref:Alpha/beta hydrolase n=1 Tax=Arthrobacter crystallopoietes BAB-32 TaxID=1246476 RepID=N1UZQ0_9MICC|nr:hypothetical protein [Arthrobacter crystallopoietes]EMY33254.1 hypothetical protein D477_015848 [Arthrobacter crystallopoietes BAB-32]